MALEVLKKLNFKDKAQPVLILNAPTSYQEVMKAFEGEVYIEPIALNYDFIQIFGTSNEEIQTAARNAVSYLVEDGLLWLCYPKKSSKTYKGSDCSRETVAGLLAAEGYEPVRQVAVDEDWSALRFRKTDKIKKMVRTFAVTEEGKKRTEQD
ncbi:DUF3052 domain-containing protein [Bacillus luteolus]|uniref:DUF3052 domain-containing protein n=1 Tax=Litchfieldia luteola TaxID=682179 RepID=A0ABR9QGC6_9BACI|nr:DUF3052 domain-containing protein [Cytobacillus luteolus]MBE4907534.1 DUF3052 domain-containing protein [Cytobacillus luteolus]MBP1944303.1 hypothetical protein [Cytobacillus luteolus]